MAKAAAAPKAAPAKKASKKAKDTGAPKRPLSAYMFMSQDWRERIKAANPDASFGEVGRLLGAKWQEMNDAQKKPYVDMAERDKLRAAKEKADYDKKGGAGGSTAAKKSSKKAAPVESEEESD